MFYDVSIEFLVDFAALSKSASFDASRVRCSVCTFVTSVKSVHTSDLGSYIMVTVTKYESWKNMKLNIDKAVSFLDLSITCASSFQIKY